MFLRYFDTFSRSIEESTEKVPVNLFWLRAPYLLFKVPVLKPRAYGFLSWAVFQHYKQWFVISSEFDKFNLKLVSSSPVGAALFFFFSFDSRWYRYISIDAKWEFEVRKGYGMAIASFLNEALRDRRSFLLQFGQRRVCTRSSVWHLMGFWRSVRYDADLLCQRPSTPLGISYKHVAKSLVYSAAVLLNQPNLLFFTLFLTNPYFWQLMQQTLHSRYRY